MHGREDGFDIMEHAGKTQTMKPGDKIKLEIHAMLCRFFGEDQVKAEFKFHPVRRWRFDYAVLSEKIAVEYQGHGATGGFKDKHGRIHVGGHASITGMTGDCEKYNAAQAAGWKIITFTALFFSYKERAKHNLTSPEQTMMNLFAGIQEQRDKNSSCTNGKA